MKKLIVSGMTLVMASQLMAFDLKEGSYKGEIQRSVKGTDDVHLMLRKAEGRDGSYMAVMMRKGERISFYLIDPFGPNKYTLTPYVINEKGNFSIVNDDPSLNLISSQDSRGNVIFDVVDSGSGNNNGFKALMSFRGESSNYQWLDQTPGVFSREGVSKEALVVSPASIETGDAPALFKEPSLNGEFQIHEGWPNLFTVNQVKTLSTGELVNSIPKRIGVFIQNCWLSCSEKFYLVNPTNDTDILTYTRK